MDSRFWIASPETLASKTKIGAVTVTYNSEAVIDGFMSSMLAQSHTNFVLYVVDNASSDRTLSKLAECRDPRLRVISNVENLGFADGSNIGVRAALDDDCDSILLINNDTEFESQLIEKLYHALFDYECDMAAPKILYHHDPRLIWSAGGGFNQWRGWGGFHRGLNQIDQGQFDDVRLVRHAPACCLLMHKSVFERIGLMDSAYFVYLDDTDFCYRATRAGLRILYLPSATLLHKASSLTGGSESEFSVRYRTRNQIYFMLKHLGLLRTAFYLPAYHALQFARFLLRRISFQNFLLREKAVVEGFRLWVQTSR